MARSKKYEQQAQTTMIRFTSRASINKGNNYYTIEACEERIIPDFPDVDLIREKKMLWDAVNEEVDRQLVDIENAYSHIKKK